MELRDVDLHAVSGNQEERPERPSGAMGQALSPANRHFAGLFQQPLIVILTHFRRGDSEWLAGIPMVPLNYSGRCLLRHIRRAVYRRWAPARDLQATWLPPARSWSGFPAAVIGLGI